MSTTPTDEVIGSLLRLASVQEAELASVRATLQSSLERRNETVWQLRAAGASYGEIAKALGLTRAGAVGICRKIAAD